MLELGLYFSHLNLTRRKFLYNRLEKTIEVSIPYRISILDNSNDPKQIIADLADFIKEVATCILLAFSIPQCICFFFKQLSFKDRF